MDDPRTENQLQSIIPKYLGRQQLDKSASLASRTILQIDGEDVRTYVWWSGLADGPEYIPHRDLVSGNLAVEWYADRQVSFGAKREKGHDVAIQRCVASI